MNKIRKIKFFAITMVIIASLVIGCGDKKNDSSSSQIDNGHSHGESSHSH